jgi:hypothetical protein
MADPMPHVILAHYYPSLYKVCPLSVRNTGYSTSLAPPRGAVVQSLEYARTRTCFVKGRVSLMHKLQPSSLQVTDLQPDLHHSE